MAFGTSRDQTNLFQNHSLQTLPQTFIRAYQIVNLPQLIRNMRVTLFNLKKPKRFVYRPRHFDPVMEDLHSRVEMIEAEIKEDESDVSSDVSRSRIRKAWNTPEARKSANNTSAIRIGLIFILLASFFYVYFFTDLIS